CMDYFDWLRTDHKQWYVTVQSNYLLLVTFESSQSNYQFLILDVCPVLYEELVFAIQRIVVLYHFCSWKFLFLFVDEYFRLSFLYLLLFPFLHHSNILQEQVDVSPVKEKFALVLFVFRITFDLYKQDDTNNLEHF